MTADNRQGGFDIEAAKAPITTRRLLLRAPEITDIPAITRLINDPVIARYLSSVPFPYAPIHAWDFLRSVKDAANSRSANFILTLRDNPRHIVGGAGFRWRPDAPPELGYWIATAFRRQGFASEATRALLARIFTVGPPSSEAVRASVRIGNAASQRVLKRAGFSRTGIGRVFCLSERRYAPTIRFAITHAEWKRKRGN